MILTNNRKTAWTDFIIKDQIIFDTLIDIENIDYSDNVRDIALSFSRYNAYDGKGYGKGSFNNGITEQQAYDDWLSGWNREARKVRTVLKSISLLQISQNVFDGLILLNWNLGNILEIQSNEGIYDIKDIIKDNDLDTLASIIRRSNINKDKTEISAKIIRLADYPKFKDRIWLRTSGIYKMRTQNEMDNLDDIQARNARFAYYAETGNFLLFTPEGTKRDIARKYNDTLIEQTLISDGNVTEFTLDKEPSMYPVEKLNVKINNLNIQHLFDFTVSGRKLTINTIIDQSDVLLFRIKI